MRVRWVGRHDDEVDAVEMKVPFLWRWFRPKALTDRALRLTDETGRPVRYRVWPFTITLWPKPD